jgi:2-C-methyl-D-erythritol 4-phosphate cytidylyltransferase
MPTALIFAGGAGKRMSSKNKPKQFLEYHGKPIIIYTLEVFDNHPQIDQIVVVCLKSGIDELYRYIRRFEIKKTANVIPGGETGFDSIFNGLAELSKTMSVDDIVLIHDGVRPLIDADSVSKAIDSAKQYGNGITAVPVTEGIIISHDGETSDDFPDRKLMYATKAPQAFRFGLIYSLYKQSKEEGYLPVESAQLCQHYGEKLHIVQGEYRNIKITTASDYHIFKALQDVIENEQIIGY